MEIDSIQIHFDQNAIWLLAGAAADVAIEVEGTEGKFSPVFGRTFSDVQSGALIAYIGSGGQLEIARRDGSAAKRIGVDRGATVRVSGGS
jgi:S-adenosylmethionine hydrolase